MDVKTKTIGRIAARINNRLLAAAIYKSIDSALRNKRVHLAGGKTVWDIFDQSLRTAIRDIEEDERGKLFRRLLQYGPPTPDDPIVSPSDVRTRLSYLECGSCIEFIYSHMVSRFKGEIAELLALEPCIELIRELRRERDTFSGAHLYWGDIIKERRKVAQEGRTFGTVWGSFTKGADGLLVERNSEQPGMLNVQGVVEVKSMPRATSKVIDQINSHVTRLAGGVKLGGREWSCQNINVSSLVRIMVLPSTWKLSREWRGVQTKQGIRIVIPEPTHPLVGTTVKKLERNVWKITLEWSREVLNQAAFQMTFWYMSQVGKSIFTKKNMPTSWAYMTPEEAGNNAIKEMLFFLTASGSEMSERQIRLAAKLYNIYAYGYALGIDARKIAAGRQKKLDPGVILWPSDIVGEDESRVRAVICVDRV